VFLQTDFNQERLFAVDLGLDLFISIEIVVFLNQLLIKLLSQLSGSKNELQN
jgi:hypothetical protein